MKLKYEKVNGMLSRVINFEGEEIVEDLDDKGWILGENNAL